MFTIGLRNRWPLAPVAFVIALAGCDAPVEPQLGPEGSTPTAVAHRAAHDRAGIPVHTTVVADLVTIGPCAADPAAARLTLAGAGRTAGLGPYELEYSYCPTSAGVIDVKVVLRTPAGELRMVGDEEPGAVVPSDHPDFDIEAHGTWRITDGTRKFEHASGDLQVDLFASLPQDPLSLAITTILSGTIQMGGL